MNKITPRKALNPAYRKHKPLRKDVNSFVEELIGCINTIKSSEDRGEHEEHFKEPIKTLFKNTFYKDNYINTKVRIDLAVYTGKDANSDVGVLFEVKRPSNKAEFLSPEKLNRKAMQELLLYYLRERIDNDNNNIKHLIATNGNEWFFFKGEDFYTFFFKDKNLIKEYKAFTQKKKDSSNNELFYKEIAQKYIAKIEKDLPFVYLNFTKKSPKKYNDAELNTLYKIFSDVHILGNSFGNDSNLLNKDFYNELLHIIGLEEIKVKGKKLIHRKPERKRDYASILENAIFIIEDRDFLSSIKSIEESEDKAFNAGLELTLTWINRILFLKLLESQLLSYHNKAKEYSFLNSVFIKGYDDLNDLFFSALAKKEDERHPKYKERFKYIPYLNSSLFEKNKLEKEAFTISSLNDDEIEISNQTVLKDAKGKKIKGKMKTLDYLFKFLDAYDFSADGEEGIEDGYETKTLINASVLGLIFEKINGYKEGSFYTPAYITMYMSRETLRRAVVQKFKEQENEQIETFEDLKIYTRKSFKKEDLLRYNKIINSLKIVDPAVGSGHFLVSALNELISIKNDLGILTDTEGLPLQCEILIENDELYITDKYGHLLDYKPNDKESDKIQKTLFHEKQNLIENCLFGVDINPNSVKICRLRLWIELLKNAYYSEDNKLQTLPNIDINIKTGNSLISRFSIDDKNSKLPAATKQKIKLATDKYKQQVIIYKNTTDKATKQNAIKEINRLKEVFSQIANPTDEDYNKIKKLKAEIGEMPMFFSQEEQKDWVNRLELKTIRLKKLEDTYNEKMKTLYSNAFEWRFEFPEVLDKNGNFIGFDIVIGNPPYMRIQEIQKTQLIAKNYYEQKYFIAKSSYDLANIFFEKAVNISNEKANCSYIFPHKFFNSASTTQFRNYLINGKFIDKLTYFGANMIFDEADTYTCIANFSKRNNKGFNIYKAKYKDDFQTKMTDNNHYGFMKYEQLEILSKLYGSNQWILLDGKNSVALFEKIYKSGITLKNKFDRIFQGIATGKDELYLFRGKESGIYIEGQFKNSKTLKIEKEILKPFLKGKDVHRYSSLPKKLYILFPYVINKKTGKATIMKEVYIKKHFPNAYKWLKKTEKDHRKKDNKSTNDDFWYRYARKQGIDNVEQNKLSSMEICSNHPNVTINKKFYHPTTVYSFVKKNKIQEDYKYLLAIINSKIMWWFLLNTGDTLQGDARRMKTNYLNPFPLPNELSKEAQKPFITKVNKILKLKEADPNADTNKLEAEIDKMVYKLYELTEEEIRIVEESVK